MSYPNHRSTTYQETSVNTASPTKLVVMLYQGSIRFLGQAIDDIQAKNLTQKAQSIDRAVAIIQHLQSTLDLTNGQEIARELDRLYTYVLDRILQGSVRLDPAPIQEAIKLLTTLLSAWEGITNEPETKTSVPAGVLANQAANGHFNLHA
jgi:flagellar protein FliS